MVSIAILIIYMGIMFWISSLPGEKLTPERGIGITISQSIKHLGEYVILGILVSMVLAQVTNKTLSIVFWSSVFSVCYGILDEIHQAFVPTRYCTIDDMGINAIGSVIGVLFYVYVHHKLKRKASLSHGQRDISTKSSARI